MNEIVKSTIWKIVFHVAILCFIAHTVLDILKIKTWPALVVAIPVMVMQSIGLILVFIGIYWAGWKREKYDNPL